ncbi:MAG: hypothetical protein ACREAA_15395 [Candidatus Polarisedimenticolia bacterium]
MSNVRPGPVPEGILRRFTRGKEHPRGIVWFGARSFWGHLRHLIASAIAANSLDSRDWMTPDEPRALLARIAALLGGDPEAPTLIDAIRRDLYIDYVADTGDDVSVSRAVARLVFARYELPDPDRSGMFVTVPRGEILLFGGDTAYPVATAQELMNRVIAPWNQVLQALPDDGRRRVLLGVPGNHDWYDGLDGFGRMFRRPAPGVSARPSARGISQKMLEQSAEWARQFFRGGKVEKPEALVLSGYAAVQNASYFALPLAPAIEMLGVDRQLTTTDSRQTEFLGHYYQSHPDSATLAVLPDPVFHFGDPSKTGTQMVECLHLDLLSRETFILTGDVHHYERLESEKTLHVIAGGGGAFLHPARIAKGGMPPTVSWPGAAQSRALLRQVPWKLFLGRSGFLPHLGFMALFALAYLLSEVLHVRVGVAVSASILTTLLVGGLYAFIGGVVRRPSVLPIALGAALVTVSLSIGGTLFLDGLLERLGPSELLGFALSLGTFVIGVWAGTLVFGGYLVLLTLLGYENTQAFTVLDHPGFKHFVRLRVRADGRGIDGWCIGAADPLGDGGKPVLVDRFSWRPFDGR